MRRVGPLCGALALALVASVGGVTAGRAAELWPQTKVRVTVIQWVPLKGLYERWDAFSGDFTVSGDGTISLPVIGEVSLDGKSTDQVAGEVTAALKQHLGLVNAPETSIEVVSYPQIYVVGFVTAPGAFEFHQGMTVLQALALGGGERHEEVARTSAERLRLVSQLRSLDAGLLRSRVRLARLTAEAGGAESITYPEDVTRHPNTVLAQSAMKDEEAIFEARRRELGLQGEALDDLERLLNQEIDTLRTRQADVEKIIANSSKELSGVQELVQKGLATASRRSDLERQIADMRFEQLNQTTAILRAQQAVSEARREAARLEDSKHTEVATAIQDEQTKIDQMLLDQATSQRLLLDLDTEAGTAAGQSSGLQYSIIRQVGGPAEIKADETTILLPGDVLKVASAAGDAPVTATDDLAMAGP